jgi:probable HAF family extracellular repeat protein
MHSESKAMTHPRQRTGSRSPGGLPVRCETGNRTLDNQPPAHDAPAEMDTGNDEMTHRRQRIGSRPHGGLPVRWARTATWTLVLGAALTLSAPPPAGWAAAGATAATPTVAPEPPRYKLVSLGTLGGETSQALAINERGDVVGDSSRADGSTHGFFWRAGKMADLGVLAGGDFSSAQDINDRGEIVGVSGIEGGERSAVIWRNGLVRALGTLPGGQVSIGLAINAGGTVVGVSQSSEGNRAFAWQNGTMRDLGILPGGTFSLARGINDRGVIVGQADAADGTVHATRWTGGHVEDLGQITTSSGAAAASIASAVGHDGLVVGYGATDSGALGAVWTGVTPRPVAALTGYAVAQLLSLNSFRQAVGDATDSAENRQIAVIVDLRRVPKSIPALFDLNTLVLNGAGWTIQSGKDVNDAWEIVGTGLYDGPERAILLRPRPFAVTIERAGSGDGTVTGPASIACGARCAARLEPGASVRLLAHPAEGSRFVRWQGACAGTKPLCTRAVDGALAVRAIFARVPEPCRCTAITTTASLEGTSRTSTGAVRVRLAIDWRLHCAAGTGARCEGQLHVEAARAEVKLRSPASGRIGCEGACAAAGDHVTVGRAITIVEVTPPASGQTVVTLLVRKSCRRGDRLRAVGVDRVELTLVPPG